VKCFDVVLGYAGHSAGQVLQVHTPTTSHRHLVWLTRRAVDNPVGLGRDNSAVLEVQGLRVLLMLLLDMLDKICRVEYWGMEVLLADALPTA